MTSRLTIGLILSPGAVRAPSVAPPRTPPVPQTLLTLLGLLLASLLSVQQLRAGMDSDRQTRAAEAQAAFADIALERLAALEALPFDNATVSGSAESPADLTPVVGGGFYRPGGDAPGDDLDDDDGSTTTEVRPLREGHVGVRAAVAVRVGYVSEADGLTPSATPTRYKRATVTVSSPDVDAPPVSLTQLYSCGSPCTW